MPALPHPDFPASASSHTLVSQCIDPHQMRLSSFTPGSATLQQDLPLLKHMMSQTKLCCDPELCCQQGRTRHMHSGPTTAPGHEAQPCSKNCCRSNTGRIRLNCAALTGWHRCSGPTNVPGNKPLPCSRICCCSSTRRVRLNMSPAWQPAKHATPGQGSESRGIWGHVRAHVRHRLLGRTLSACTRTAGAGAWTGLSTDRLGCSSAV